MHYDSDINKITQLTANTLAIIKSITIEIGKKRKKSENVVHTCLLQRKDTYGLHHKYCGVIPWYLTKKLRQFA